ncbi:IS3 family transposase [Pseudoalteromonas rubra]|uniref:IS3 family transposase n=1 Tax=Pseudoalteromonas rubra TaxID=43658 RepID=UPI0012F79A8F|nr:IS3 family transposase [Pseudoalteromonas rubra]
MSKKRRNHSPEFKAKVALAAARGDKTTAELAAHYNIHQTQITTWKNELIQNAASLFTGKSNSGQQSDEDVEKLHAKIGQLTMENGFFGESARSLARAHKKNKLDKTHSLALKRQCELLEISRASAYYKPKGESQETLDIMKAIDEINLNYPFMGSRRIVDELAKLNYQVNRKKVTRLMRLMGILVLYPKPKTTVPDKAHRIYPYLLRDTEVTYANQVWATDISYIPMAKGFVYVVAIIDWFSRKVLSWKLSNTLDTHFCLEALDEALQRYGKPQIFNSDQGCQFTSDVFTGKLKENDIKISMDGKGRWVDNVMIERLWRSLKYEEVYLKAYDSIREAEREIGNYFVFYNEERIHQSLEKQTPDEVYHATQKFAA